MYDCGFKKELQCDFRKILGEGSYGKVFKCVHRNERTGDVEKYVVKHSSSDGGIDRELEFADSIEKGCALNSKMLLYTRYVIPIYRTNKKNAVALRYAQVFSKYKTESQLRDTLTIELLSKVAQELHDAVNHIHTRLELVHNDIKPDNIGFLNNQVKLLDLGLTKSAKDPLDLRSGTVGYKPPNKTYDSSIVIDMWAVGCTLFEIVSGSHFSIFWADSTEELELIEFATAVIMEDLVDTAGEQIVKYLLGYTDRLDLKEFQDTSMMGFHTAMMQEQFAKLRDRYAQNLAAFASNSPSLRAELTQKIMRCFEYSFTTQRGGKGFTTQRGGKVHSQPFLKIPVNLNLKHDA
jgi:serine/threonine protein kinase